MQHYGNTVGDEGWKASFCRSAISDVARASKHVPQGRLFVFDRRNSVAVGDEGASPSIVQGLMEAGKTASSGVARSLKPKCRACFRTQSMQ